MTEITTNEAAKALTPPTPQNVAEMLTSGDGDYHDGNDWHPSITATGSVIAIGITPVCRDYETELPEVHFRVVVVEGEETPLVLDWPSELGISWEDGGDLLSLAPGGIRLHMRGLDEWGMSPAQAREMAAQLVAMAAAYEAAQGGAA